MRMNRICVVLRVSINWGCSTNWMWKPHNEKFWILQHCWNG